MKLPALLLLLPVALTGATGTTGCNADNCARAVTGTAAFKTPVPVRQSDCSSFQLTTVTPLPSTTTIVTTVTSIPPHKRDAGALDARQVTVIPAAVPTYASACSGAVRYKSACSCWGITESVTTAPTPVVTVISTVTVTPHQCNNPGPSCGTYQPIVSSACGPLGVCLCVTDTDGRAVCVEDISCSGAVGCTSDANCPGTQVCWAAGCCTGAGLCAPTADICPFAPARMLRMLRREAGNGGTKKRADVCTNSEGCPS